MANEWNLKVGKILKISPVNTKSYNKILKGGKVTSDIIDKKDILKSCNLNINNRIFQKDLFSPLRFSIAQVTIFIEYINRLWI